MKREWIDCGLVVLLVSVLGSGSLWAVDFAGGTGEPNDPYQIATAEQLCSIGSDPNLLDKHYVLINNIDLDPCLPGGQVFTQAVIAPGLNDNLGEFQGSLFSGSFNGLGHVIQNMTILGKDYLGLFGCLGEGAIVTNLGVEDVNIIGVDAVGGIVGFNDQGCLSLSYNTGSVKGNIAVGGLVGDNEHGDILLCYNNSSVYGNDWVGGLVGYNFLGNVMSCYNVGKMHGKAKALIGNNEGGSAALNFWNMEISGITEGYGGIGLTTIEMEDVNTYLDAGWDLVGEKNNGICDFWYVQEGQCPILAMFSDHSSPEPNGLGTMDKPYLLVDVNELGMVWRHPTVYYRLQRNLELSGMIYSTALVPAFAGNFDGNDFCVRNMTINGGGSLGLFGFLSRDAEILKLKVEDVNVVGIDQGLYVGGLAGYSFGIVKESHITGLVSNVTDCVGGVIGYNCGHIYKCFSKGEVVGQEDYIGGLVGYNRGVINECYFSGSIVGENYVGGLVGYHSSGVTKACYSEGTVSGDWLVGGLIGQNTGYITNSYSTSIVSGDSQVAGLIGRVYSGVVENCFSSGFVTNGQGRAGGLVAYKPKGSVETCFWDIETSGWQLSDGGIGLPTAQMQDISIFWEAGWDFVGEEENGTEDIWVMPDEEGYPRLSWE